MASPKSRPKTQNRSPIMRSLWPSIPPRKLTVERSGSLRAASPPPVSPPDCAKAAAEQERKKAKNQVDVLRIRQPKDVAVAIQVRIEESSDMNSGAGLKGV